MGGAGDCHKSRGHRNCYQRLAHHQPHQRRRFGINAQTVIVTGNIGVIEATAGNGVAINAGGDANVTNGTGTIQASVTNGIAIAAGGKATVGNGPGTILGRAGAIQASTVNVTGNDGTISASGNTIFATTGNADIINGSGSILATGSGGIAISAGAHRHRGQ